MIHLFILCFSIADGLNYLSKGTVYFYSDQLSVFACKFIGMWYVGSEAFTQWLLAALMAERLIAIQFPFHAKYISTTRNALFVCLIVLSITSTQVTVVGFAQNLVPTPAYHSGVVCVFT